MMPDVACAANKFDKCVRCGRPVPPPPQPLRRSLEREREYTEEAARGICSVVRLIEHSEVRALRLSGEYVRDPMLIKPGRNRLRDASEEASDARNHLVFWFEENPGDERAAAVLEVLGLFAAAYDKLDRLLED